MTRTEYNPAMLGVFVVGAFLLAVFAIVMWGPIQNLGQKKYVIFFNETVTGLETDAAVRLNGIVIGKVDSIDLAYLRNQFFCAVVVKLDTKKVLQINQGTTTFEQMLDSRHLSAQLGISTLLGFKLDVEMKIGPFDPSECVVWDRAFYNRNHYFDDVAGCIPARQSPMARVMEKLEEVFKGPGITNLLDSVTSLLDPKATNGPIYNFTKAMSNASVLAVTANKTLVSNTNHLHALVANLARQSGNLEVVLSNFNAAALSVPVKLGAFSDSVGQMSTNFASITATLNDSLTNLDVVLNGAAPLPPQAVETLRSLQDTFEGLQRILDYVERHPDALVRGRAKEN